ncbi:MAG: hypothetical protein L3J83_12020 [Proteobacteria bacterium]|nr:hypothetical protein [Pseudomonadota bacterium]
MSLFNELKRRNVIRVGVAYLIIDWLLAQVSTTLENALNLPVWFDTLIVTVMLIGFPLALIIVWVYELTPEGIKKEKDIKADDSLTNATAKKLDYINNVVKPDNYRQKHSKPVLDEIREFLGEILHQVARWVRLLNICTTNGTS